MIFDVMIREGYKYSEQQKCNVQVISVHRVHDRELSKYLRDVQYAQKYIIAVIPLFRPKLKDVVLKHIEEELDPIDPNSMIDSHGF